MTKKETDEAELRLKDGIVVILLASLHACEIADIDKSPPDEQVDKFCENFIHIIGDLNDKRFHAFMSASMAIINCRLDKTGQCL